MKKTMSKIIALVAVAVMIFSFASCTQTLNVRFVDKDGNDINLSGVLGGNSNAVVDEPTQNSGNNETPIPGSEAPTASGETPTAAGETPTAAGETPTVAGETPATAGETPATQAPATQAPSTPTSNVPATKAEILDFYKNAVARVKNNGEAGYAKKEWQALGALEGFGIAESAIKSLANNYMTKEDAAEIQACAKGSDRAKERFPNFVLTDYSKVSEATLTKNAAGNYEIKIVLQTEDTPKKSGNFIGQCTNSVLWWEDIENEIKNISIIKSYEDVHVIYENFTITAEITPAGNFVSLKHYCPIKITIGAVQIVISLKNKGATLENFATYTDFAY